MWEAMWDQTIKQWEEDGVLTEKELAKLKRFKSGLPKPKPKR